jgi:tRNA A37 threonylcarbamoyladenosine dehydratase
MICIGNPDYVVDCIGDLSSKLDLLKYCYDNKIPVMSSMSAGAKADPSRVQISDISETFGKFPGWFFALVMWPLLNSSWN